jgi:aspartyl protease family protein
MTEQKGPWRRNRKTGSKYKLGFLLFFGLIISVGLILFALLLWFPHKTSSDDVFLEIIRLLGILALVSSSLIYVRRIKFNEVIKNISIWTGLASVILIGYTYRTELSQIIYRVGGELVPGHTIISRGNEVVITASADGHFYISGKANEKRIRLMVDTGASEITLSPEAAKRIGINLKNLSFTQHFHTANGIGLGAIYWLKNFSIGPYKYRNIKVSINQTDIPVSLLGMSFLERLNSFEFKSNKLYLRQ